MVEIVPTVPKTPIQLNGILASESHQIVIAVEEAFQQVAGLGKLPVQAVRMVTMEMAGYVQHVQQRHIYRYLHQVPLQLEIVCLASLGIQLEVPRASLPA